ncbi:MAG: TetR/AcrR family transcriptional regulator, partial [Amphiplicatus sp.]|nr:TetR/AcrR family transcriptional regulator [Amphiplicatus sp.]
MSKTTEKRKSRTAAGTSPDDVDRLPRTPKGWRTREKLIEAAIVVINRNGYSAATVEEIVKQAKLPIGSFYRHFKNRVDITHSALEQVAAEYRQGVFSMSPRNALFQREVVVHNLLY